MDQRNLLIAIVLSVAILIAFQFAYERFYPPAPPIHHPTATAPTAHPPAGVSPPTVQAPGVPAGSSAAASKSETRAAILASEPHVAIATPALHGSIALKGARFDNLTLARYHVSVDPKSPEVVLLRPSGTADAYFAEFGWVAANGQSVKLPGPDTVWTATTSGPLTPTHPVTLEWNNGEGLIFTRTISVDRNYMFTIRDTVRNTGKSSVNLFPYGLVVRTGTPPVSGYYLLFEGMIGYVDGALQEIKYSSLTPDQPDSFHSTGGWLGYTDKYWLTALIPPQNDTVEAQFTKAVEHDTNRYQVDFRGAPVTIAPGATGAASSRFFAGAKELSILDAYAATGIPRFDRAIDFGWFYFLTKPIFLTLRLFKHAIGNFGLAILLFTLLVKLLFFPLANKSYKAMSRMRLLQPEMQKLRERFPDDKARQQQEMMALYKRVGANPLAGCLPIVIQIPVFYALYKVLYVSLEMRHAPFFGWIHDLSAPDPTSFVNLFGLLPFAPPPFLMIGAWPIIMGVTMFLQQKLNPQPVDPVQAR
ncbi:MAG TPA: membrane protein insertase YidC, partial [Stellaceae bacterium]|nr:membrane protein insertase YidC [Stellaceae bacterium]